LSEFEGGGNSKKNGDQKWSGKITQDRAPERIWHVLRGRMRGVAEGGRLDSVTYFANGCDVAAFEERVGADNLDKALLRKRRGQN